ncbi:hypothetical protein GGS23DRAFT_598774 [Durotheca rogersii]|uniref:uncharacterized protein n=1 Tax=Durotheca rogersii TaxID=419775 RepID=UPI00221ED62C|nr:uncharacterized protein GGS23DRAFT_598774 [Durotheca rogersii]KAI5861250.1 hypothetical protein GGS23DRAFT_598774 [Durotheca rogersii]
MGTCSACREPLVLQVNDGDEDEEPQVVPDDLEAPCGCHFHWQCLFDQASELVISLRCPSCGAELATSTSGPSAANPLLASSAGVAILTTYTNEGGIQEHYDILPEITEEAYLDANPEARPARAYHVMCSEGDVGGIVELLRDAERADGDEPRLSTLQLVRYQDPLGGSKSGLHLAVERRQTDVVWLLLWIASTLPAGVFPDPVRQAVETMGIQRPSIPSSDDIRALRDNRGRTAEAVAAQTGGRMAAMMDTGVLYPGPYE